MAANIMMVNTKLRWMASKVIEGEVGGGLLTHILDVEIN